MMYKKMASTKRISRELADLRNDPPLNCSAGPISEEDVYVWEGVLFGPEDSPYAGGVFKVNIQMQLLKRGIKHTGQSLSIGHLTLFSTSMT